MEQTAGPRANLTSRRGLFVCAGLLLVFAAIAWTAVLGKAPVYDEPLHAVGAWTHLHWADFRIDPEDPPLWHYWAALPNGRDALKVDLDGAAFRMAVAEHSRQWGFVVQTLYYTPGNDLSDAFILRGRAMMLLVGIGLGALVAWWSWRLGGAIAAVAATALFAFDPNVIAHAPLVKNDVALALVFLATTCAVWRAGRRLTLFNLLAIGLLCGAGLSVKFSGLLLGPVVAVLLLMRALLPQPWTVARWGDVTTRLGRVGVATVACVIAAVLSVAVVWASYGFRFAPAPDPTVRLNMQEMIDAAQRKWAEATFDTPEPSDAELAQWSPGLMVRSVMLLESHQIMPQAWLYGLLYTYQSALARPTFLLGQTALTGWWFYFPLVILFKTPLAMLIGGIGALMVWGRSARGETARLPLWTWEALCLVVPPAIYLLSAMASNLNLGMRHILPIYPFVHIGLGLAVATAWAHRPRLTRRIAGGLAVVLMIETLATFPHYIAFFNAPSTPARLSLLSDSNLDWGQDLTALAAWRQSHRDQPLYLAYFGMADPGYYGIDYVNLPGAYYFGPDPVDVTSLDQLPHSGILAVSATVLQGTYVDERHRALYGQIRNELEPVDVLGRTIYLYDLSQR